MRFKRDANLQTMCLHVVAENLNIFSTPSSAIEVYIEFLRRCYSNSLSELIEKKCDSKKYLVWLISPHWKNVSLPGTGYSYSDILCKFKAFGNKITSLNLEDSACSADILSAMICCLPNVTFLNLSGTSPRDDMLLLIRRLCPNLNALNLSNCRSLTDTGLKNLCYLNNKPSDFPSLKALNISSTHFLIQSIVFILKHLTSLQILNHSPLTSFLYNVHKPDLGNQRNVARYNLTYLEYRISRMWATAELESVLEVFSIICPYTNNVFIQDKLSESKLQLLTKFKVLKKLRIVNIKNFLNDPCSVSPILTLKGTMITQLLLFQLNVSADVIVNSCPNLKYLFLCGMHFEDFKSIKNTKIPELKHLEALNIKNITLDEDCTFKSVELLLSSSINLNHLCIQYAKYFTDSLADVILKLPDLVTVDFSFTDIELETLLRFFAHPDITKVGTDGCPRISYDEKSCNLKFVNDAQHGNTCSWEIDYSEYVKTPIWPTSFLMQG